ncbi:MAG: type II secretion system F family protein [Candidatus Woesearchaeota archaeon]
MDIAQRLYKSLAQLYPHAYRTHIGQLLLYTQATATASQYLGMQMVYSLSIGLLGIAIISFFGLPSVGYWFVLLAAVAIQLLFYLLLYLKAERITEEIERVLPDALQVIASNLDAGATPFQAIKSATRKEFGILAKLFDNAIKRAVASENFAEALKHAAEKTNSAMFKRAVKLIISSLSAGGNLSKLMQELAEDISQRRALKEEMVTNTKTYTMFIMFTIVVGAPLLFAISIHFVTIVNNLQTTAQLSTNEFGLGFLAGGIDITPQFLTNIAYSALIIISLLACMMMGVITSGKAKIGFKYAPFIVGGSLVMFLLAQKMITALFGGMM